MKIYTKTGDDGTTGLIGGQRVSKSDARIQCIGAVDELNAAIGWAAAGAGAELAAKLRAIQNELFIIGAQTATPQGHPPVSMSPLEESSIGRLESQIDAAEATLQPLANFILPGGSESSARLHLARTICRRAERTLVGLAPQGAVPKIVLTYLNRLGDWLFVQARWANRQNGVQDVLWRG